MEYLFNEEKVTLIVSTYASYNNLYVGLISEGEPYPAYNDIYVFIPATKHIIKIAEGTGNNLNNEDYVEGYVDYIDYTAYQMEDEFPEYDGGMIMLKEEFRIKYKSTEKCIPDVLEDLYNDREQPFIVLK